MGGIGSGRRSTTHEGVVEDAPALSMRDLRRLGLVKSGECVIDTVRWSQRGLTVTEARVRVDLSNPEAGTITLTVVGQSRVAQTITVEGVPCRYGGHRFYFTCPEQGRRCEVLCWHDGRFACRQAHRLSYATQGMDKLARARKRRCKLKARLDGQGLQPRARGRHRYELVDRLRWATMTERALFAQSLRGRTGLLE